MAKNKKILKLYNDFENITNMWDLQIRNLTLSDYNSLLNVINELAVHFESDFTSYNISQYLKKFNIKIISKTSYYLAKI